MVSLLPCGPADPRELSDFRRAVVCIKICYPGEEETPERALRAEVMGWDVGSDPAALKIVEEDSFDVYFRLVEEGETIQLGKELGVLSYPLGELLGHEITYTRGVVSSLREIKRSSHSRKQWCPGIQALRFPGCWSYLRWS